MAAELQGKANANPAGERHNGSGDHAGSNGDSALDVLLVAAMVACKCHGDGDAARNQMRLECTATPSHLHQDLLEHFERAYGGQVQ